MENSRGPLKCNTPIPIIYLFKGNTSSISSTCHVRVAQLLGHFLNGLRLQMDGGFLKYII